MDTIGAVDPLLHQHALTYMLPPERKADGFHPVLSPWGLHRCMRDRSARGDLADDLQTVACIVLCNMHGKYKQYLTCNVEAPK